MLHSHTEGCPQELESGVGKQQLQRRSGRALLPQLKQASEGAHPLGAQVAHNDVRQLLYRHHPLQRRDCEHTQG